jgi:hypothetical protein
MERTLSLRLMNTPARGEIARHAVLAVAVKVGLPPVAADRAGTAVAGVVAACQDDVTVTAALDGSAALLTIAGGGDRWCRDSVSALQALDARAEMGRVAFRLMRTPLRAVSDAPAVAAPPGNV